MPASTWVNSAWSICSPENSAKRTVSPMGCRFAPASASVMLVPLPPKSHNATTPWVGRPGSACRAARAAVASEISIGGTPPGANVDLARSAPRKAPTAPAPQYAGTAMTTVAGGSPLSAARAMDSSASAARSSARCGEPSAATSGTGSPTRSTKPRSTRPAAVRLGLVNSGFCDGTPTSEGRLPHSVSTDRRLTGWLPGRAATRLIVPIDNPSESLNSHIPSPALGGRSHHSG